MTVCSSGNTFYRGGDHQTATEKYKKCCKYIKLLRDTVEVDRSYLVAHLLLEIYPFLLPFTLVLNDTKFKWS